MGSRLISKFIVHWSPLRMAKQNMFIQHEFLKLKKKKNSNLKCLIDSNIWRKKNARFPNSILFLNIKISPCMSSIFCLEEDIDLQWIYVVNKTFYQSS